MSALTVDLRQIVSSAPDLPRIAFYKTTNDAYNPSFRWPSTRPIDPESKTWRKP